MPFGARRTLASFLTLAVMLAVLGHAPATKAETGKAVPQTAITGAAAPGLPPGSPRRRLYAPSRPNPILAVSRATPVAPVEDQEPPSAAEIAANKKIVRGLRLSKPDIGGWLSKPSRQFDLRF